jgi:uncharacterized protein (TIGR03437 family)
VTSVCLRLGRVFWCGAWLSLVSSAAFAQVYPSATVGAEWQYSPGSYGTFEVFTGAKTPYTNCQIVQGSLPPGFTFGLVPYSGTYDCFLGGTPTTAGTYSFTFTVTDDTPITSAPGYVTITVNPRVAITTSQVPSGAVGVSYSFALQESGGTAPFQWAVAQGNLPAGLTLNASTGTVSGTPTAAGTYPFSAKITDQQGATATASLTLVISGSTTVSKLTLGCQSASGPTQAGVSYLDICTASGGAPPYNWTVPDLPAGLSETGLASQPIDSVPPASYPVSIGITGTPTAAGSYSYTVKVTDDTSPTPQTVTQTFTGTIVSAGSSPSITSVVGAGLSVPLVKQLTTGGIFTIFGSNFAPAGVTDSSPGTAIASSGARFPPPDTFRLGAARRLRGADLASSALPTNMASTCVQVGSSLAPLFYVSAGQINAQAPTLPSSGTVQVSVIANCGTSNQVASQPVSMPVAASAPEFLYFAGNATGPNAVAAVEAASGTPVGPPGLTSGATFAPAHPGDTLTIYGVGFGATSSPVAPGALPTAADPTTGPATVTIGGTPATVLYAGFSPGDAGLYQVNLIVPQTIQPGNQSILLQVNGGASPFGAYLAIAAPPPAGATLTSISIAPQNPTLFLKATQQLDAVASYSDGSVQDVSYTVQWTSSAPTYASVSQGGVATGVAAGTAVITASIGGVSCSTTVTTSPSNSGLTIVNDLTDSRLMYYQAGDGSVVTYFGTRNQDGTAAAINALQIASPTQPAAQITFDSQSLPSLINNSDGSQLWFNWSAPSNPLVTLVSADGSSVQTVALPATTPTANLATSRAAKERTTASAAQCPSSPSAVYVHVTSCKGTVPEDNAIVTVTQSGGFGGSPILAQSIGSRTGEYCALPPSGPTNAEQLVSAAAETVQNFCSYASYVLQAVQTVCAFLKKGAIACEAAAQLLQVPCYATTPENVDELFALINALPTIPGTNYLDSLNVSTTATASLDGQAQQCVLGSPDCQTTFNFDFACPLVDHVTVSPFSSQSMPLQITVGGSQWLTATAYDEYSRVIQSSAALSWTWMPSSGDIQLSSGIPPGSTIPFGLQTAIGAVPTPAGQTDTVTATASTPAPSSQSGTSWITVVANLAITALSPSSLDVASQPQPLTIVGTGFVPTPTVAFNGVTHTVTYVSSTELTIQLTATDLATTGTYSVVVANPPPNGGSANASFTVTNPVPTISSLSPSSLPAGSQPQLLEITGTGFVTASTVTFAGAMHTVAYGGPTELAIQLTAADLATVGTYPVVVANPEPGGGSNFASFTVTNPAPTITSLSPSSAPQGSPALTLTIYGTGFLQDSTVTFNNVTHPAAYGGPTQLTIQLSASDLAVADSYSVVVTNPPPSSPSAPAQFVVTPSLIGTWSGNYTQTWGPWTTPPYTCPAVTTSGALTVVITSMQGSNFSGSGSITNLGVCSTTGTTNQVEASGSVTGSISGSSVTLGINFTCNCVSAFTGTAYATLLGDTLSSSWFVLTLQGGGPQ